MRFDPELYATVAERINLFYEKYTEGRLIATIVEHDREHGFILMRAEAYRSPDDAVPASTGHAYEVQGGNGPQASNYIEVCESSAIGRALANLNFQAKKVPAARRQASASTASANTAPAPSQIVTSPSGPKGVRPVSELDANIRTALTALEWSDEKLNGKLWTKYKSSPKLWSEHTEAQRFETLAYLNNVINKRNVE